MKTYFKLMVIPFLAIFLFSGAALAVSFGTNITISDRNYNNNRAWYSDREDNEVEPGMDRNQSWDLEGFFLSSDYNPSLTIAGGYNFINGNSNYSSGDIFIDTNGDAEYGRISGSNGNLTVQDTFGYDYVIDINSDWSGYTVYELDPLSSYTTTAYYAQNEGSSPWQYDSSINSDRSIGSGQIDYQEFDGDLYLQDIDQTLYGDKHYAASLLGLSLLRLNDSFTAHFTMQCGNDNLMGSTAPVPEPATLLLFGTGLIGLAGVGRKKFKK